MRGTVTFFLLANIVAACGGSSGASAPVCSPPQSCIPSSGAIPCMVYVTACDAASGVTSCVASGPLADGDSCGLGNVCLASTCVVACVPGLTCTPAEPGDICKTYATACSAKLTVTSCAVGGNQIDGTACGSALVCSTGTCVTACVAGVDCSPVGPVDPCKTYLTTCTSTLAQQVCAPAINKPDGTTCNGTSVCQAGSCLGALAPPTLSPISSSGAPGLTVTLTGPDEAALVYYTTDGTPPSNLPATTSRSFVGSRTLVLQSTATVQAFAVLGLRKSATVVGVYTITAPLPLPVGVALGNGFASGSVQTNGSATIVGSRLQLTPSATYEVASAFYPHALNVQTFTTDFSFQILDAAADGMTFVIQGRGPFAMGSPGGGLGYGPNPFNSTSILSIDKSVAIKFDTLDNEGEGSSSTGLFTNGAVPTIPAVDLYRSGIDLRSGHVFDVHMAYDGSVLALTITDEATTPISVFNTTFPVDIPTQVGGITAYAGFTAATGQSTGTHQVINWTFANTK